MKKILENIKPFDKFWFRSCFYQAFLSVVQFYGGDVNKYFANQILEYKKMKNGHLTVVKKNLVRYNRVEGIREHRRKKEVNLFRSVKDKINNGYPIIIATDSFYIPYRNDCYLKEHSPHYICIYGYDDEKKRLFIFDHRYWGSYKYEKKEILYSDILRAYLEYGKQYPTKFTFYWYSPDGKKDESIRKKPHDFKLLRDYIGRFQTDLKNRESDFDGYRLFFEGETWLRIPVMEMFQSYGQENYYRIFSEFINTARLIWAVLKKYDGRQIPVDVRIRLSQYSDRFLKQKEAIDKAEEEYYASLFNEKLF